MRDWRHWGEIFGLLDPRLDEGPRYPQSAMALQAAFDEPVRGAAGGETRVCHLAAQAGVRHSIAHPNAFVRDNVQAFTHVLELCRDREVGGLIYASSSSVYGDSTRERLSEKDSTSAQCSLYGATKKMNELMASVYNHLYGLRATGLRFFTVYGPWGRPDMALFSFTRAILNGDPIDLYNHGDMERDFTYIDDVVEAVLRVIDHPPQGAPDWDGRQSGVSPAPARVYNVGNGEPVSVLDLVSAIEQALGKKAIIREVPIQPGDVPRTWADGTALREELGYAPHTPVREGVSQFVSWYRRKVPVIPRVS